MFCRIVIPLLALSLGCLAQGAGSLYSQIGGVKGQVVIVNHPDLGRTPAAGTYFVLQRAGCRNCLIGVRTDNNGRYKLNLGAGKYRLYCEDTDRTDLVRRGQSRVVTVKPGLEDVQFDRGCPGFCVNAVPVVQSIFAPPLGFYPPIGS